MTDAGIIYLLHYRAPLGDPTRPRMMARHYVGHANPGQADARIRHHRRGTSGAALPLAFFLAGITFEVAATWPGTLAQERRFKANGHYDRKCRICHPLRRTA